MRGESTVCIANTIPGTFTLPEHARGGVPGVLLLHGFASQKDEVGNLYAELAVALSELGIASLRIDFIGSGDSKADFADLTVQNQVSDAMAALLFLRTRPEIDAGRIGLLGFSLGGGIAILTASRCVDYVRSLALWSSVGDLERDMLASLGQDAFTTATRTGSATVDLGFRVITLKNAFFTSLRNVDLTHELARFAGPVLFVYGATDPLIAYADTYMRATQGPFAELLVVNDGDHIYNVLSKDKSQASNIMKATSHWFLRTV